MSAEDEAEKILAMRVFVRTIMRMRFGSHSFRFDDWWCDLCKTTIGASSVRGDSVKYYRKVICHYKYVHNEQFALALLVNA
jgi:hypothetical protein